MIPSLEINQVMSQLWEASRLRVLGHREARSTPDRSCKQKSLKACFWLTDSAIQSNNQIYVDVGYRVEVTLSM